MALLHSHFSPLHRRANIVPSLRRTSGYTLTSIARSSSLSRRRSSFEASHARADHDREKRLSDQSSWEAKDSEGDDYLFKLGQEAENMNIAVGARKGVIDDLFVGEFLGKDSDIVFDYRQKATRSFEHLKGDYYITPEFKDKVACHIVKNYLSQSLDIKVPLILGIWGGKGQGKTFQTELIFRAMGVEPVIMSAGELESEKAEHHFSTQIKAFQSDFDREFQALVSPFQAKGKSMSSYLSI